jgi:hypothetical protein
MKNKETLEDFAKQEAIKQYSEDTFGNLIVRKSIEKGAKWETETMYSEEDIARAFNEGMAYETMGKYIKGEEWVKTHKKEWFEQFKKK